ncbi:hypothetical protein WISP_123602 [Willisornis vidua]|uniref:Uncharacterized protein n=1 Tax=Willisornis vidua TaxID=1566151 RepID=A0ABQ9CWU3_9PASS|nr:hypothetical protein WISP_123602 [Willisornis vidua]
MGSKRTLSGHVELLVYQHLSKPVLHYLRMDKDFRYYFQHPWSRLVVAYLVIFFNFLIFAEDPVSHSQTEANVIVVAHGNFVSFAIYCFCCLELYRTQHIKAYIIVEINAMSTYVSIILNDYRQKRIEIVKADKYFRGNHMATVNLSPSDLGSQCGLEIEIEKD